jgi:enamine deaminase RidA (YjgF/YER057c/UK114 family)
VNVDTGDNPLNTTGRPLARYAAVKQFGDYLFCSGVIAVDPAGTVLERYDQLPGAALRQLETLGYHTGQFSVDVFEAPIVVQSWAILERIRTMIEPHGVSLANVARLVQYFRDLRHYPAYNRVRGLFFPEPVVSTVVEVSRMLPNDRVWIEIEATVFCPAR